MTGICPCITEDGPPLTYGLKRRTPGRPFVFSLLSCVESGGQETGREMQDWGSNTGVDLDIDGNVSNQRDLTPYLLP